MSFAIVVDSTCDLTPAEAKAHDIAVIPLNILLDGKEYRDQVDITSEDFFGLMAISDNLPKTAQPSPYDFAQLYQKLADEGAEQIISIHICAVMSGTLGAATMGADQVDVPVTVIDSAGVTAHAGLLALYASQLRERGLSAEETVARVKQAIPHVHFMIAPVELDNLIKGGRLSAEEGKAAGLLNIKPLLGLKEDGTLHAVGKARGMKGVVKSYVKEIEDATAAEGTQFLRLCHTGNIDDLQAIRDQLAADGVDYVDFGTAPCGATVATHLGLGGIGFACLAVGD